MEWQKAIQHGRDFGNRLTERRVLNNFRTFEFEKKNYFYYILQVKIPDKFSIFE